ncbi:MAG TPA: TonB C-terminal domain-containing protein, partial [Polyangia bacterium]|nr:TonB C-terminal domain-containing protein [Polyangia bacterium]
MVITLALHGGLFAAIAVANNREQPPLVINRDFVVAEMVKLGKPRDKFWLPRIVQPQRSTAPPDAIKVADDPNAKAAPKEAPRPDDPTISKDLKRALDRARKLEQLAVPEEPDEGSLTGSKLGTSNHEVGDAYQAQVVGMLHQNYNFPAGIDTGAIATPPEIAFHIGTDGTLADVRLTKPSGNSFVDDACVDAAKLTA